MKNDNIVNSKLYEILNYITYFLVTNILFLVMTSPLTVYWFICGSNASNPVLLLLSILLGPAITTLFSVMGRLIREGEIDPVKDFFHFYKLNLFQSLIVSVILNICISIIYFDISYFSSHGNKAITYLFLFALVFVLIIALYIYPIISRYNLKLKDLLRISLSLFIKKPYISLSSISIIIITLWFIRITKMSLFGLLLGGSLITYVIFKIQIKSIDELEDYIKDLYKN